MIVGSYRRDIKLAGLLYLHRITDNRVTHTLLNQLPLLRRLCGPDAYSIIRFVTTGWDLLRDKRKGEIVEQEFRSSFYVKSFLESGSQMRRFHWQDTCSSAWEIINSLPMGRDIHKTAVARSLLSRALRPVKRLFSELNYWKKSRQKLFPFPAPVTRPQATVSPILGDPTVLHPGETLSDGLIFQDAAIFQISNAESDTEALSSLYRIDMESSVSLGMSMENSVSWHPSMENSYSLRTHTIDESLMRMRLHVGERYSLGNDIREFGLDEWVNSEAGIPSPPPSPPKSSMSSNILSDLISSSTNRSAIAKLRGDEAQCMADFLIRVSRLSINYYMTDPQVGSRGRR